MIARPKISAWISWVPVSGWLVWIKGANFFREEFIWFCITFISVDTFQVYHMPDDVILIGYTVRSQHISSNPGDLQRFASIVSLQHRHGFRSKSRQKTLSWNNETKRFYCTSILFSILKTTGLHTCQQSQTDLCVHVSQLLLNQLICC